MLLCNADETYKYNGIDKSHSFCRSFVIFVYWTLWIAFLPPLIMQICFIRMHIVLNIVAHPLPVKVGNIKYALILKTSLLSVIVRHQWDTNLHPRQS